MTDRQPVIVGIDTRPIPLKIGEVVIYFDPDPTDTDAWARLMGLQPRLAEVQEAAEAGDNGPTRELAADLRELLAMFAHTPEDRVAFNGLDLKMVGLSRVMAAYAQEVAEGIPS